MKHSILTRKLIGQILPERNLRAHKGDFGHVFILSGSRGMTGAAVLCATACLKSGSGLVTLGIPKSQLNIVVSRILPEIMTLPLPETRAGSVGVRAYGEITKFLSKRKIDTLAIGPGLSTHSETKKLVKSILKNISLPTVLDADGINVLVNEVGILKKSKAKIIMTPHPGELSRLIDCPVRKIEKKRIEITKKFAKENNIICVLKGYGTVISDGNKVFVNQTGNPGMATAGSGDVLTGMLSGLIHQIKNTLNAVLVGVYIHGLAGDLAARDKTQIFMTAGNIIEKIPYAIKKIRKK